MTPLNRFLTPLLFPFLALVALVVVTHCTPAARVAIADQVFDQSESLCALVGFDNGAELKICRTAAELARLIADLALSAEVAPVSSTGGDVSGVPEGPVRVLLPAGASRVVSVRLIRSAPSVPSTAPTP